MLEALGIFAFFSMEEISMTIGQQQPVVATIFHQLRCFCDIVVLSVKVN